MSPSKLPAIKWKPDFISRNLARGLAGRDEVNLKKRLKKQKVGARMVTVFARNAVMKLLTNAAFLAQQLSVQNVKLI